MNEWKGQNIPTPAPHTLHLKQLKCLKYNFTYNYNLFVYSHQSYDCKNRGEGGIVKCRQWYFIKCCSYWVLYLHDCASTGNNQWNLQITTAISKKPGLSIGCLFALHQMALLLLAASVYCIFIVFNPNKYCCARSTSSFTKETPFIIYIWRCLKIKIHPC